MSKVYISPSDQVKNLYAWGGTNEHEQCQKIANTLEEALKRSGVTTKILERLEQAGFVGFIATERK